MPENNISDLYKELSNKTLLISELYKTIENLTYQISLSEERLITIKDQLEVNQDLLEYKCNELARLDSFDYENIYKEQLTNIYNNINIKILKEHLSYVEMLEKDSYPNTYEDIIIQLKVLIKYKKEYAAQFKNDIKINEE